MGRRMKKVALAPLVGLLVGLAVYGKWIKEGYDAGEAFKPGAGWDNAFTYAIAGFTGYAKNLTTGVWEFNKDYFFKGAIPVFGGMLGGMLLHKVANKAGINRAIPWFSI